LIRIAANDYEDLVLDLDLTRKKLKEEIFHDAVGRLEVTLSGDSGIEISKRNHDEQVVVWGKKHRQWSWEVLPRSSGAHQPSLVVQGISGPYREDYDPEVMQYSVAFSWGNWFSNGVQQNGWVAFSAIIGIFIGAFLQRVLGKKH
jgi:hypothetical protein